MIKIPSDRTIRLPLVDPIPQEQRRVFTQLTEIIRDVYTILSNAINTNTVEEIEADSAPTLVNGQMVVWKDTDATSTNPTHYLMYRDGNGDVVTFASEELVP